MTILIGERGEESLSFCEDRGTETGVAKLRKRMGSECHCSPTKEFRFFGDWKLESCFMEKRGTIVLEKGEYVLRGARDKECKKTIVLRNDGIFYGAKVDGGKIVCDEKTVSGRTEVWF